MGGSRQMIGTSPSEAQARAFDSRWMRGWVPAARAFVSRVDASALSLGTGCRLFLLFDSFVVGRESAPLALSS